MNNYIIKSLVILICSSLTSISLAGTHFKDPEFAYIRALDVKKQVIVLDNEMYFMHKRIKINSVLKKFASPRDLYVGMPVDYKTIENRKTGRVEVSEIWVKPQ